MYTGHVQALAYSILVCTCRTPWYFRALTSLKIVGLATWAVAMDFFRPSSDTILLEVGLLARGLH